MSASNKVLVVDAGNTSVKWAAFEQDELTYISRDLQLGHLDADAVNLLSLAPERIYFASVRSDEDEASLRQFIHQSFPDASCYELKSQRMSCGVRNAYENVSRLGIDRWLTVIAAFDATQDTVVIDAGTALKVEFVDANGQYRGGYIVPGQIMMENMLVEKTGKIRFNDDDLVNYQGQINNTGLAVHLGCWEMTLGLVERVLSQHQTSRFVFTGGNGKKIMQALKIQAQYEPHLVLKGAKKLGDEWVNQE